VTFFAFHRLMQSSQRITRFRMVKLPGDIFPVVEVVTLQAVLTQTPRMLILVTSGTSRRNPQVCPGQIFHFDLCAVGWRDFLRQVAFLAHQAGMFPLKREPSFLVIESPGIPFHDGEIEAVMLRVTTCALLAGSRPNVIGRVQAALSREARRDFRMAVQTFEHRFAATHLVAVSAVCSAIQRLVGTRERSRRDLGVSGAGKAACSKNQGRGQWPAPIQERAPVRQPLSISTWWVLFLTPGLSPQAVRPLQAPCLDSWAAPAT